MVAEEVPAIAPLKLTDLAGHRVGVRRSREQATRLASTTAEVRPALDADPAEPGEAPTMQ